MVRKLQSIVFTIFNRLENNNNAQFSNNGEEHFLNSYIRSLDGNVTLVDVGGNIGDYSSIMIKLCNQCHRPYTLHIFEPTRACFEILNQKFSSDENVIINNVGVSDTAATQNIYYDKEQSGLASLYMRDLSLYNVRLQEKEAVPLIRLDEYFEKANISVIDYLKIDIEGHELSAFKGMGTYLNTKFIKVIQFEYGGANLDSGTTLRELYAILENAGYVIGKIMKRSIDFRPYSLMMENYQYANYVAFSKEQAKIFQ